MRIATWNVNSIVAHEDQVLDWVEAERPDVLCMQETKVTDQAFPEDGLGDLGYDVEYYGQSSYNGVAIASRSPVEAVTRGFEGGPPDAERRLIAATIGGVRIINVYVPNGQTLDSPQYAAKLEWMRELLRHVQAHARPEDAVIVLGDFNVAPADLDVWDIEAFRGRTHVSTPERRAFHDLLDFGLTDALRHFAGPAERPYTFWDYQGSSFLRNRGMRIDHILVTRPILERAVGCTVHREARAAEKRSDHAPVVLHVDLGPET